MLPCNGDDDDDDICYADDDDADEICYDDDADDDICDVDDDDDADDDTFDDDDDDNDAYDMISYTTPHNQASLLTQQPLPIAAPAKFSFAPSTSRSICSMSMGM